MAEGGPGSRLFAIEQGVVEEGGSNAALLALGGRYAELVNLQAGAYHSLLPLRGQAS